MAENSGRQRSPADQVLTLTHEFVAPRELVWRAYTEAGHLAHWWGPKGFTMVSAKVDLRPGGMFHYFMRSPEGYEMWGKMVYQEIVPPERLVTITGFSDPLGNFTRHPLAPDWPLQMLSEMILTESAGRTQLTMTVEPFAATAAEIAVFQAGFDSMRQGFGGSLRQLDAYLAQQMGVQK